MIIARHGNKSKIASEIIKYFPIHDVYVELFFGGGGMFFNKPKAKYNFLNDLDNQVYLTYKLLQTDKRGLIKKLSDMPQHESIFNELKKSEPTSELDIVVKYLYLATYSFKGTGDTMKLGIENQKRLLINKLKKDYSDMIYDATFLNRDFRDVLNNVSFNRHQSDKSRVFVYADPPYQDVGAKGYKTDKFQLTDFIDLLEIAKECTAKGFKIAISEFDNPKVIELAKTYNLNIIVIGERVNIGNRKTEILLTNYTNEISLFETE